MSAAHLDVRWRYLLFYVLTLTLLFTPSYAVKHHDFKTCDQSGFCKRNRAFADEIASKGNLVFSPYNLDGSTLSFKDGIVSGTILKTVNTDLIKLPIVISFLESGAVRVEVDEEKRKKGEIELRHQSPARKERYNEAEKWAIVGGLELGKSKEVKGGRDRTVIDFGPDLQWRAMISHTPFSMTFIRDDEVQVKLNGDNLLNIEHWRPKVEKPSEDKTEEPEDGDEPPASSPTEAAPVDPMLDESTWWEETFGGNTDSKPRGPESVGLDITFPGYEHVYGIPGHASTLSLKETRGGGDSKYSDPYRMYNLDVFEYEMDSPMALYGAIPFMQAQKKGSTVGVFWLNGAETWVDITKRKRSSNPLSLGINSQVDTRTHWFSESGVLDVFVFLGPTSKDILRAYSDLTGYTALPQHFSIAYHQCRWNYNSDEDVKEVDRRFDRANIPYDVIWLDIEYTEGKKYFTWDPDSFTNPLGMQKQLDGHERKLVVIIDPHIKNEANYRVAEELKSKDLGVKNKENNLFEGWCWPGSSHWIDCFSPTAVKWWQSLFQYSSFQGTSPNVFLWNDMNEPSVFNGPETTMPKDNLHYGSWEHRDVHNINGMTFQNATYEALARRDGKAARRPFVLTRSYFSGSQRLGAMWTGDNEAKWSHLKGSLPMIMSHGIAGFPFSGADVGGFFGNPDKELLTRWYQAGIFYPFFRGHAHIDTRRREPYLPGEPYTDIITDALRIRYQLLPLWYTAFHAASTTGEPIVRPNWYVFPSDESGFGLEDQLYIGSSGLLAKPVTSEGQDSVEIYLADDEKYYDYFDYTIYAGKGKTHKMIAPLEKIPLLMQGGHIIPRKDRPRRSSGLMRWDPYTLVVVLSNSGNAEGTLYVDDGESFDYQSGAFIHRQFNYDGNARTLESKNIGRSGKKTKEYLKTMSSVKIEKLIIIGAPGAFEKKKTVSVTEDGTGKSKSVELVHHRAVGGRAAWAMVRDLGIAIEKDWKIDFS